MREREREKTREREKCLHASHAENAHDGNLCTTLHMQGAHEEYRQQAHGEITQRCKRTVHIGHGYHDLDIHARSLDVRVIRGSRPEILQGLALQQHDEHEHHPGYHRQTHHRI